MGFEGLVLGVPMQWVGFELMLCSSKLYVQRNVCMQIFQEAKSRSCHYASWFRFVRTVRIHEMFCPVESGSRRSRSCKQQRKSTPRKSVCFLHTHSELLGYKVRHGPCYPTNTNTTTEKKGGTRLWRMQEELGKNAPVATPEPLYTSP